MVSIPQWYFLKYRTPESASSAERPSNPIRWW